ncbi:MAG TPA: CoA-binding protein [Syntrophus sp. (in: bacteria)]|nr:MAG: CoA-binding protein [Syntrophus sp. GWC2_56_31]HBB15519.1 CoA-binding protein [Syntrophus sp. (in: bacteria)]
MNPIELIRKAKTEGRTALTEAESKEVLEGYGVPVVPESIAATPEEAVAAAEKIGFPVVLKGLGEKLTHKTEWGLVFLNLSDAEAVRKAAAEASSAGGADLEGILIQPMLSGRREFVAGLFRDAQFGPVVMFGLGGIFAEALDDVVFRIAPLDKKDAGQMLEELRARALLGPFRGEQSVCSEQLVEALVGLSRIGMELPDVTEVDINPLLVSPDGRVTAVDALIILGQRTPEKALYPPIDPRSIAMLFYPRSIAFVGASGTLGKWGYRLFCNVVAGGFKGPIHLVNPKGGEIAGRPVFKSVLEIPGSVDLAVVTIPAAKVLDLVPQLKEKRIKNMLLITSGFAETGAEGRRLEEKLVEAAREADILILGPNTMGICNPHDTLFCCGSNVQPKPGATTIVSQSGNLGVQLLDFAEHEGIGIRAFGGSGNEAMITIEDYMEAFEVDDLTQTVVLYLESIKNGRRFFQSAKRVGKKKPVIMLKGGRTQAGDRAAASHTGALASNIRVFEAAARQAGIIVVEQPMDLLDLSAAFSSLPLPRGNRVALMTLGGGWGVVASDLCVENGLTIPDLSPELIARIDQILPPYWSRSNPIDLVGEVGSIIPKQVIEELMKWDGCDAVIHLGILGLRVFMTRMIASIHKVDPVMDRTVMEAIPGMLVEFEESYLLHAVRLMEQYGKPILGVNLLPDENTRTVADVEGSPYKGVSFLTPERAVKALARMYAYRQWRDRE